MTFTARGLYARSSKEPPRRRIRWLWLGAFVGAVAVLIAVVGVADGVRADLDDRRESFAGVERVEVRNETGGDIRVVAAPEGADEVSVVAERSRSLAADVDDALTQSGSALLAEAACTGILDGCAVDYAVQVPAGTEVDVEARSGEVAVEGAAGVRAHSTSGEVEARGLTGAAELSTVSGGIEVEGAAGGRLALNTVSGEIEATGLDLDEIEATSTSGEVSVEGGFDQAVVESTSGAVEVAAARPFGQLSAHSTSGSLELRVPGGAYTVSAGSTSGSVESDVPDTPGADARITAESVSGSVEIRSGSTGTDTDDD
ncbi:DUF4097 family beta strand repeat-containing protein [Nocardiopsis coralliicola]